MMLKILSGLLAAMSLWGTAAGQAVPAAPAKTYAAAELRADFTDLYEGMKAAHYDVYVHTPKAELDRAHAEVLASLDRPMTADEARVRFQTFVSRIRVAHARIDPPSGPYAAFREAGGKVWPVEVRIVGGRVHVARDLSGAGLAPGDEIVSLEGATAAAWLDRVGRHVSADTPYMLGALLEFDLPRLLWMELGPVAGFRIQVRQADGRIVDAIIPARSRAEIKAAADAAPPAFALDYSSRLARMLAPGLAYLRPGPFYNAEGSEAQMWDTAGFKAFIDRSFEDFIAAGAKDLIIDLRDNPGGDNSFSDHMVAWFADRPFRFFSAFRVKVSPQTIASNQARLELQSGDADAVSRRYAELYAKAKPGDVVAFELPFAQPRQGRRFTGRVWMLINRNSYSNTVTVAALAQDLGFARILGEETSDMATTYGAMETFKLPRTGIVVGYPKAHIIRPNGDLRSRGVAPDIAIETPVVAGKDDAVLARAVEIVSAGR